MSTVDFRLLDIDDAEMVDQWFALWEDAMAKDMPGEPVGSRDGALRRLRSPRTGTEAEEWIALADGRVVANVRIRTNTIENLHSAQLYGVVHPDLRRRGIGSALWAHALDRVRAKGCTTVGANAADIIEGRPTVDRAGAAFLTAMGMTVKLTMILRRLDLSTVDKDVTDTQLAEAWAHADGYALRLWVNHTPPDLIDGVAYLESRLLVDSPTGGLDIEPSKVDAQRVRDDEAAASASLTTAMHAAVVHNASGRVVAWSKWSHGIEHKGRADQLITIVDPDHRGHRLGTVVKLELQRYATAVTPGLRLVSTLNAAENAHMIRINELVGYRPVRSWLNYQAELADLPTVGDQS